MSSLLRITGIPNIVLIGVPSVSSLVRVKDKLEANGIDYYAWEEPDMSMGFTAIATIPLDREQKVVLANYRLWRPIFPDSSKQSALQPSKGREETVVRDHLGEPNSLALLA